LNKRFLVSLFSALAVATLSGIFLYETLIANNFLGEAGLSGMFLAAMLSHLTVIGRGIFIPAFLTLTSTYHPIILGTAAGLGGALGEATTYYLGLGIGEALEAKDKTVYKWINKYGLIAILILAASPLPDAPIILLAGSSRFPFSKILLIEGIGKIILYILSAIFGGFLFLGLTDLMGELLTSILIVIASLILCIIVSWEKARNKILKPLEKWF